MGRWVGGVIEDSKRTWTAFVMTLVWSGGKEGHQQGRSGGLGVSGVHKGSNEKKITVQRVRCSVKTLDGSLF